MGKRGRGDGGDGDLGVGRGKKGCLCFITTSKNTAMAFSRSQPRKSRAVIL